MTLDPFESLILNDQASVEVTMSDRPPNRLLRRASLTILALLVLAGFAYPLLLVPAAFVAWALFGAREAVPPAKELFEEIEHGITALGQGISRARAIQEACAACERAFSTEEAVINGAFRAAERSLALEDMDAAYCGQDEERAKRVQEIKAQLEAALKSQGVGVDRRVTITIPEYSAPAVHPDPELNEAIQRTYRGILDARSKLYDAARRRLHLDARLREKVKASLESFGCAACWEALSKSPPGSERSVKAIGDVAARISVQPPTRITGPTRTPTSLVPEITAESEETASERGPGSLIVVSDGPGHTPGDASRVLGAEKETPAATRVAANPAPGAEAAHAHVAPAPTAVPAKAPWPHTVEDAAAQIISEMDGETKQHVLSSDRADLMNFHFGLGTAIRNRLGLWEGNTALLMDSRQSKEPVDPEFLEFFLPDPDDCSAIIIERVWEKLREAQPDREPLRPRTGDEEPLRPRTDDEEPLRLRTDDEGHWLSLLTEVDSRPPRELSTLSVRRPETSSNLGTNAGIGTEAASGLAEGTERILGEKIGIQAFVAETKVPYLLHFTRAANLPQILSHGLLPIDTARQIGIAPYVNDNRRLDGRRNGTSLSVAFPNYRMFWKYRQENPDVDWVVLAIDPSVLWLKDCAFCRYNAADARISSQPAESLRTAVAFFAMFDELEGQPTRQEQQLNEFDPTDGQAEVLVFDIIAPQLIKTFVFESSKARDAYRDVLGGRITEVHGRRRGFFATRSYVRRTNHGN